MHNTEKKEKLDWQLAQEKIAKYLSANNFSIWEERKIGRKRVDILAKRVINDVVYYLIFEIKNYNKISASEETKFEGQLLEYLKSLILREKKRKKLTNLLDKNIFVGYLVFSNDYGIYHNRRKNWRKTNAFEGNEELETIWKRNVHLFCSTPGYIQKNLDSIGLQLYKQKKILDFFDS